MRTASTNAVGSVELLAPLTSAANLPNHPSLSIPYLSTPLSDMVRQACQMLHRERRTLWNIKHLLTKLRGDETWIPCGKLNSNIDHVIFNTDSIYEEALKVELSSNDNDATDAASGNRKASSRARINRSPSVEDDARLISVKSCEIQTKPIENSHQLKGNDAASDLSRFTELASEPLLYPDKAEIGVLTYTPLEDRVGAIRMTEKPQSTGSTMTNYKIESGLSEVDKVLEGRDPLGENSQACLEKKDDSNTDQLPSSIQTAQTALACQVFQNPVYDENVEGAGNVDHASQPMPHRMQTRARAQAATENPASSRTRSITPNSSIVPTVHPLYLMPSSASPDRNFGLPPGEAEETRRMVILYAQKQEEICRGAEKLYAGLLKADRMRKTVFQWCKAEGHVGQMSDGEDWYDKEEWGLEEDLRKGHDDEEDEAVTQVKRTRGRRS